MKTEDKRSVIAVPSHATKFDKRILEGITWFYGNFHTHHDVATVLKDKHPYTITVLIELLNYKLRDKKEYVKKTYVPVGSKYRRLLYDMFFEEYGRNEGNKLFGKWLDTYRPLFKKEDIEQNINVVDEYIVEHEFEPRYKQKILTRFMDHTELFKKRREIRRDRYYNLPEPLNCLNLGG